MKSRRDFVKTSALLGAGLTLAPNMAFGMSKTSKEKFEDLEKYIVKNHPYSMPAIVSIPWDDSHEPYRKWVDKDD